MVPFIAAMYDVNIIADLKIDTPTFNSTDVGLAASFALFQISSGRM
jgi:hypothetical protein